MGLLSDLAVDGVSGGGGSGSRKGRKVRDKGASATGRLTGITVVGRSTSEDSGFDLFSNRYRIEVDGQDIVCGIDQELGPEHLVRLGMPVALRVLKDKAVLDPVPAPGMASSRDIEFRKPPERGIQDAHLDLGRLKSNKKDWIKGPPATITILDAWPKTSTWAAPRLMLQVRVEGSDFDTFETEFMPKTRRGYASHLERIGAVLPGAVRGRKKKPIIDWATAAEQHPGVGEPPGDLWDIAPVEGVDANSFTVSAGLGDIRDAMAARDAAVSGGVAAVHEGIDFPTWAAVTIALEKNPAAIMQADDMAVERGAPAGMWWQANASWTLAAKNDPAVKAALDQHRQTTT